MPQPRKINEALIQPVQRGPTLTFIFQKLTSILLHLFLIDASSAYHNLRLDKQLSYLIMFLCKFGKYR